ncbi:MAG: XRE family transcriptional regulator [Bryobacterales bacterium]|nr:XRE family transcriptional regulator [Bryobacterales bacterium]
MRERLLAELHTLIRSGQFTERGLARHLGVSQPHLHNVLAGVRALTFDLADHAIATLDIPWDLLYPNQPHHPNPK